ncbi:MAG: DnaB helicase C-terminal domain-containing protein [Microthrixaceae bacterium]|nr:DnaB helicase C-terminal domain-containing protein [Microthrixaceae bacterium]
MTLFEAETPEASRPLLLDIAGHVDHVTLLAGHRLHWNTACLWGAAARVSQEFLAHCALDEADWDELTSVIGELATRDLWISESLSYSVLDDAIRRHGVEVLAVEDISRFDHPCRVLGRLVGMAVELGVAVVATSSHLDLEDLRGGDRLVRVGVHHNGGRSTLVRPDPIDLLRVEDVFVDHVTGFVN